jgi:REP element-mobilizing transposase RayT
MRYRRADAAGGTYFFTVNLAERRSDVLVRHIDDLRAAMKTVKDTHSFAILAMVVLPEHLHAICRLPPDDADYPCAGLSSRPGSRGGWQKASIFVPAAKPSVSEASGSGGIGNIKSGMILILRGTSITFITIP